MHLRFQLDKGKALPWFHLAMALPSTPLYSAHHLLLAVITYVSDVGAPELGAWRGLASSAELRVTT